MHTVLLEAIRQRLALDPVGNRPMHTVLLEAIRQPLALVHLSHFRLAGCHQK